MLTFINNTFQGFQGTNRDGPGGGGDVGNGIGLFLKEVTNVTVKNNKLCSITGGMKSVSDYDVNALTSNSFGLLFISARKIK
ncbi:MAG: hypothetical protein ACFFC7_26695 [Candidatus Hermodarchaeota archaeon]